MIGTLQRWGVKPNLMYTAGFASVGMAFASWAASNRLEAAGLDRADRWGIFVGEWAPTFFAIGIALRMEEMRERALADRYGQRGSVDEKVTASRSAAMP